MNQPTIQLVDQDTAAKALGLSRTWLERDRRGAKLLPYVKLGLPGSRSAVRYDLARCVAVLAQLEQGGATVAKP